MVEIPEKSMEQSRTEIMEKYRIHEKDIVKALIFSVSNRLYTQDKAKDAQLMSQNTILTLGHIAVALRHEEKVTYF